MVPTLTPTERRIAEDEGFRRHIYVCPAGKRTIGYGFNLDAGMSREEAQMLLSHRVHNIRKGLGYLFPWFNGLSSARQDVLISMAYQMGMEGLCGFKKFLDAVSRKQWERAVYEMMDSKWAREDSPERARRLALLMQTGVDAAG